MDRDELKKYHDDFIQTLQKTVERLESARTEQEKIKDALIEKITKALSENNSLKEELKGEIGKLKLHSKIDFLLKILPWVMLCILFVYTISIVRPSVLKVNKGEIEMSVSTSTKQ